MIRSKPGMYLREQILNDVSNVKLMHNVANKCKRNNIYYFNFLSLSMSLIVTDINDLKYIFNNSPKLFGVGNLKKKIFSHFMTDNVGVSNLKDDWEYKRIMNEFVLETNIEFEKEKHMNIC